jgi:glycosyltransferase involved in cell wall biosynthesis
VLVISNLKGNGAERVVLNLAEALLNGGHKPHIICFSNRRELQVNEALPISVFKVKRFRWIPESLRWKILSTLLDRFICKNIGEPHLVISNLNKADKVLCYSKLNAVMVLHSTMSQDVLRGLDEDKRVRRLRQLRTLYGKKPCVAVSHGVKSDFNQILPACTDVKVIFNPLIKKRIEESSHASVEGVPERYIIHVGKFNEAKRHDILLRAYAHSGLEIPLVLVGKGSLENQAKQLINELGISDKVILLGFKSNPYPYIKRAEFMVLSSEYEGLPTVILEALCLRVPVISTDCPSGPNEILPSENLVENLNFEKLGEKMREASVEPGKFLVEVPEECQPERVKDAYLELAR